MLATRIQWCLEHHQRDQPAQIGFRQNLDPVDDLAVLTDEVLHASPYSHLVRTVIATDIEKSYDNAEHEAISW